MKHSTSNICEEDGAGDAGRRAAREGGIPSGGTGSQTDPPLLTGGLKQPKPLSRHLRGVACDWLTVTMSTAAAIPLVDQTRHIEQGGKQRGYRSSERRLCQGGDCWRKTEPHQRSRDFGKDYETWEFTGGVAHYMSSDLRKLSKVRPTRFDVAFDLAGDITSDEFAAAVREHRIKQRLKGGAHVDEVQPGVEVNTRYIGTRTSDRRVRIYRKDLQSEGLPPTLRVELILKNDRAVLLWQQYLANPELAYREAAGHVLHMTGCQLLPDHLPPQPLPKPVTRRPAAKIVAAIRQAGLALRAAERAGVPVHQLLRDHGLEVSRVSQWREDQLVEEIQHYTAESITDEVSLILFDAGGNT